MSEASNQQTGEQAHSGAKQAGEQAEKIAGEGENVRDRVRQLVVETVQERKLDFDELGNVAQSVLEGAAQGVRDAAPEEQDNVLRSVIDGLADSYSNTANAARLAFEEATQQGRTFAEEDLKRAWDDLRELDQRFLKIIGATTERGWGALKNQAGNVKEHAQRSSQHIRGSLEGALTAAKDHPVQLGSEAAKAGVEATRQTTGRLLQVMAGMLQGAGDALSEPRKKGESGS